MEVYDCAVCAGACCESITLPLGSPDPDFLRWLLLRGQPSVLIPGSTTLECRCTALTNDGRCSIYADRPRVCRDLEPGGIECRTILRRRRTAEQINKIVHD
jgi:Fe-S-cluster containining protein